MDFISKINAYAIENYTPDVTIFIDLSPAEAFARKKGADENDRLEQAGMEFHNRVYEGYLAISKTEQCIEVVNGRQTPDEIFADVLKILKKRGCL